MVASGREALERLRAGRHDCMVLDLRLPDMSGFEVLEVPAGRPVAGRSAGRGVSPARPERRGGRPAAFDGAQHRGQGAASPERLFDETSLFLHHAAAALAPEKQRMLERLHGSDEVLAGRTVLVVDDDARNIFALSSALERRGMRVLTATTGAEAISILEARLT